MTHTQPSGTPIAEFVVWSATAQGVIGKDLESHRQIAEELLHLAAGGRVDEVDVAELARARRRRWPETLIRSAGESYLRFQEESQTPTLATVVPAVRPRTNLAKLLGALVLVVLVVVCKVEPLRAALFGWLW